MAGGRRQRAPTSAGDDRRSLGWWLLVLTVLLAGSFPYFTGLMNANERPRLLQGMALVDDGSWSIDGPAARGIAPGPDVARGHDGRLYPNKAPGASVVAAGAYLVARTAASLGGGTPTLRSYTWWARLLGSLLPTLVVCALALRRRWSGREAGTAAVVLYALATPAAVYARVLFGHQLAAALLFAGVLGIVDAVGAREGRWQRAALGGLAAGSAVAVEYSAAFAGIPIAIHLVFRWRRGADARAVAAALGGALVPVILLAAYQDHVFGSPLATPYHHVVDEAFAEVHARGLLGLGLPTATTLWEHGVSPWGGILYWVPLLVVAATGFVALERHGEGTAVTRLCAAILGLLVIVTLCLAQSGGWRVGPRYLVVAFPMMIPGLAYAIRQARSSPAAFGAVIGASLWSASIVALAASLFPHLIPVGNPLFDQLLPLLLSGRSTYGLPAWLLWLASSAAVVLALARVPGPPGFRARAWALGIGLAVAALALASVVPADPQAEANLRAIESIWEPRPDGPAAVPLGAVDRVR